MKFFIDFDDVIFNTKEFRINLKVFFNENGVSDELIEKYYYDEKDRNEVKLFDPEGLINRLEWFEKLDVDSLRKNFSVYMQNLSSFIFPDVDDFLKFTGKENTYLISFGLPIFQNEKITACGVYKLVSGCVVTRSSKSLAIAGVVEKMNISRDEKIVFIDDRIEQVQDIKKNFPFSITFLLCRKEGRYCDTKNEYCDYEIHDLIEAQEIISKLN